MKIRIRFTKWYFTSSTINSRAGTFSGNGTTRNAHCFTHCARKGNLLKLKENLKKNKRNTSQITPVKNRWLEKVEPIKRRDLESQVAQTTEASAESNAAYGKLVIEESPLSEKGIG